MIAVPEMIHQEQEARLTGDIYYKSAYKLNLGSLWDLTYHLCPTWFMSSTRSHYADYLV